MLTKIPVGFFLVEIDKLMYNFFMEKQGAKDRQEDLENKDKYQTYYEAIVIRTAQDWHMAKTFWTMEQKDSKNNSPTPSPAQNGQ